jgi:hypothetical protein
VRGDANEQTCVLLCIPCSARQAAGAFLELDADHFEIGTRACGLSSQAVHLAAGTSATLFWPVAQNMVSEHGLTEFLVNLRSVNL